MMRRDFCYWNRYIILWYQRIDFQTIVVRHNIVCYMVIVQTMLWRTFYVIIILYYRNRMYRGAWYINTRSLLLLFITREWCCRRSPFLVRIFRIIKHNNNDCLSTAVEATGVASQTEDGPRNRRVAANWHCEQSRHGEPCQVFAFRATVFLWKNKIFRNLCARKIMCRCGKTPRARARERETTGLY